MIGRLRGEVIERAEGALVVDVQGVGYRVTVSAHCPFRLGERADLHIHTHVREDAISLFGFADSLEREVFHLLLGVPSVGPVKAMGILQTPVEELVALVGRRDAGKLAKLPGVGKKTAERILLDLGEKMAGLVSSSPASPSAPPLAGEPPVVRDLISALVNLGFRDAVAEETARGALGRLGPGATLEALLRESLSRAVR